ncbi:MAG TPA: DUF6165 family protein [Holophagaceae bacterium]|nr:DUF6165 family protein [Holophagaceae bacterium]
MTEVSWGELIDKYTILAIKAERLNDAAKVQNVRTEMEALAPARDKAYTIADISSLEAELKTVNETLWVIEDDIRDCERAKDFGPKFVELARAVYHRNDERAAFKRQINERLGSRLMEEKSYKAY